MPRTAATVARFLITRVARVLDAFVTLDVRTIALRVVERLVVAEPAASARLNPSRREHEGQAPQPCASSTFSAMAICSDRLAPLAVDAYAPPP